MRSLIEAINTPGRLVPATAEQLTRLVPDLPPSPHHLFTMQMYLDIFNKVGEVGADTSRLDTLQSLEGRLTPSAVVQRFNLALYQGPTRPQHLIEYGQMLFEVADSTDPLPDYSRIPKPGFLPDWLTIHFGNGETPGGWDSVKIKIIDTANVGRVVAIDAVPTLAADARDAVIRLTNIQSYSPWIALPQREPAPFALDTFKKSLRTLMVNFIGGVRSVDTVEILPRIIRHPTLLLSQEQRLTYDEQRVLGPEAQESPVAQNLAILRLHEAKMNNRLASVMKDVFAAFRDNLVLFNPPIAPFEVPLVMQHLLSWPAALAALQAREHTVLSHILSQLTRPRRTEPSYW